jgi:hypothetical protein
MVESEQTSSMSDPKTNAPDSAAPSGVSTPPTQNTEAGESPAPSQLTKEEQWALFEKELKESDWGHQPC